MKPKLKENPREWIKFTLASCAALALLAALTYWRKRAFGPGVLAAILAALAIAAGCCLARPAWFRTFYRGGMTLGFYVGQVMGRVLLTLFFVCALTPLGLLLRLLGKDFLRLRKDPKAATYLRTAKPLGPLDKQF